MVAVLYGHHIPLDHLALRRNYNTSLKSQDGQTDNFVSELTFTHEKSYLVETNLFRVKNDTIIEIIKIFLPFNSYLISNV